jgi:hypothetical protein
MNRPLPPIPPGPADSIYPRRALARLALSAAYRKVADFAAGGVPTVSDEFGDPWDYVDHAARLVAMAQDVLSRAVLYARERGGTWPTIAEALDITVERARDQHTATMDRWEDALDQPWERSGRFLSSRMPDGTTDPDATIADLDQWCLRHLDEHSGARHNARHDGIEDRMVSVTLPQHTPLTEMNSLTRTAAYLTARGAEATHAERDAYQARKTALLARLNATGGHP